METPVIDEFNSHEMVKLTALLDTFKTKVRFKSKVRFVTNLLLRMRSNCFKVF